MGHRPGNWGQSPKGWTDIGSDVCWEEHGGLWVKRDKHSSLKSKRAYYVLRFSNLTEEMRERDDDRPYYEAATAHVDLDDRKPEEIASALRSCGWVLMPDGKIMTEHDGSYVAEDARTTDYVILSALAGYGLDWDFETGDKQPLLVRSRAAKRC
jgi:hypothetical protein